MADNTELNPGVGGDVYASDDIAGIKFQRVKLVHGIDGVNAGDVAATNPFPVGTNDVVATGSLIVLNDSVILDTNGRANVAFQINYTVWTGQITFEGNSGDGWVAIFGYLAGTGQTKTAYTNPASGTIYRCTVAGFSQVRVRLSNENTGSATIYARASSHTSGVFLNFPLPQGANVVGQVGIDQTTDGSTNKVFIGNSPAVSVSNMVAQGLTDTQLRAAAVPVTGTFYQATQPVSIATMPSTPVTGTFYPATQPVSGTVEIGATSLAALETISVANFTDNGLTDTQLRAAAVPVSQPAATDWRSDMRRGQTLLFAAINASGIGDNTLVAADVTKKIKVLQYTLISAGIANVTFKSGAGTSLSGAMPLVANSGVASPFVSPAQGHLIETAVNQALVLNLSAAIAVTGHLTYILEV